MKDRTHRVSFNFLNVDKAENKRIIKLVHSICVDMLTLRGQERYIGDSISNIYFSIEVQNYEISFDCVLKNRYVKLMMLWMEEMIKAIYDYNDDVEVNITIYDLESNYAVTRKI